MYRENEQLSEENERNLLKKFSWEGKVEMGCGIVSSELFRSLSLSIHLEMWFYLSVIKGIKEEKNIAVFDWWFWLLF